MHLDPETASLLGWDEIREQLAARARTPHGAALCRALEPSGREDELEAAHQRQRSLALLEDQGLALPIEPIEEIAADLIRASKGGLLEPEQILRIARAMWVSSRVRAWLMSEGDRTGPALVDLARGSHDLSALGRDLTGAFDPDGQLRDSASAELFGLRRQAERLAEEIRVRLERLMRSTRFAAALQEPYITQRSERYVLPVRADARGEVEGIVHDASGSGATLFIEPGAVVDAGNRLKIARAAVAEEQRRILAGFSREIAEVADALCDNLATLAKADLVAASVRLGRELGGRLAEVRGVGFDLLQARHPLMALAGGSSVANDIRLPPGAQALVITGPNAGGKTVALKTLGLCCVMAQAGLPIPAAEGSRLGRFERLGAVIGDSQDIGRGLSTFSAHIERIGRLLAEAGPHSLVLLDELAADTDPRHGAALAAAILQELVEAGATSVVTTHYEELKQLPYQDRRLANASVGFDLQTMAPTFALHPDLPGRSLTLDIARRLGLPERLIERAAARLESGELLLDQVLANLEDERQALGALRAELAEARDQAERTLAQHRQASEALAVERTKLAGQGREELLAELTEVRGQVAEVIESLRAGVEMKQAVDASHELIRLQQQIGRQADGADSASAPRPQIDLRPGDQVLIRRLGRQGLVSAIDRAGAMVSVRIGPGHTRVPIEQVELVARKPKLRRAGGARPRPESNRPAAPARPIELRTSENTLDLRGQRADEAAEQVDAFLDRLFGAGEPSAFVIHGHGTGALRAAVREHLADSPYPRLFRAGTPEEGGDGVTVVVLK